MAINLPPPQATRRFRIAIIGGGWAGLAAAVELCQAGAEVTLFEAAKQLGGRARAIDIDGHRVDNGQHILIGAYRETLRLMRLVGADPEQLLKRRPLEISSPRAGFHLRLPRLPAPFHLAIGLAIAKGCPWREKLHAALFIRALQASNFQLPDEGSVANLLERYQQGPHLQRLLWAPLCLAALNTVPAEASAQIFANVLRDSLGGKRVATDLLLPAANLDQLFPQAAERSITANGGKIHLSTRIESIACSAMTESLTIRGESFDRGILAVAPQHAAKLLAQHTKTAPQAELIGGYHYEPIATVYAGYPADIKLPLPMLGLESHDPTSIGQWVFDRGALGSAAGQLSFVLSGHGRWENLDDTMLQSTLHDELEVALGKHLPAPHWCRTIRERRATFSCRPGLARPPAQTTLPGLWLAGDYVCADYPATLEGAVRSGVAAANGVWRSLTLPD